jgi:hypothetical protein
MYSRIAAGLIILLSAAPAMAEELQAEQARHFVAGKLFSYTCFEGTRGSGRIYYDGSVAGTIQFQGTGKVHYVRLPPNTLRVEQGSICASVRGIPFQPCFNVDQTSRSSFRGSISGFGFAYCDFNRPGRRIEVAHEVERKRLRHHHHQHNDNPPPLRTAIDAP